MKEDEWVEIPDEELAKKGKTQWVYKPSNYIVIDAFIGIRTQKRLEQLKAHIRKPTKGEKNVQ